MKSIFLTLMVGVCSSIYAQQVFNGLVTDKENHMVASAVVKNRAGTVLAITDSHGLFKLTGIVPDTIVISHVSYVDYVLATKSTKSGTTTILLTPVNLLMDEVIVSTGFQRLPRERATGSFTVVDNEMFNQQVGSDVLSRLEAVASGLNVDHLAEPTELGIRIRGQSTFSSGAMLNPLIILDNFPYEGDLSALNPNSVEDITLLKDAAASSIWGARAANGVIVITTKRASAHQPLRVDFNNAVTLGGKPDLYDLNNMSSPQFAEVERFLFGHGYRFDDTMAYNHPAFSPVYEILFRQRSGQLGEEEADAQIDELAKHDVRDDYMKYLYQSPVQQQYALSLSGSGDKVTWLFSTGFDREISNLSARDNRLTLNFRNTYQLLPEVHLESGLLYTESRKVSGLSGFINGKMLPYAALADTKGDALPVDILGYPGTYRRSFLDDFAKDRLLDWHYYPLTDDRFRSDRSANSMMLLNTALKYRPFPWLGFDINYQYGRQLSEDKSVKGKDSFEARNLINSYTVLGTDGQDSYNVPRGDIYDINSGTLLTQNLRGQLSVDHRWEKGEINMILGLEASEKRDEAHTTRMYGYDPEVLTFSQVDYVNAKPLLVEGYSSYIPQNEELTGRLNRFVSTYFNGAYSYRTKYTVSASGRRDASNLFGVDVNDRWNLLWSAGLAWEISKERFYNLDWMPYMRLRMTYGYSGNTDPGRSALTTIYYSGTSYYFNVPMAYISQDADPSLKWEKVRMINLGLDFHTINGRVSGSFAYFRKYGKDMLAPDPLDYTTGIFSTVTRNVGEFKGRGFDLQLVSLNTVSGSVKWLSDLNLSYYDDEVLHYYRENLHASNYVSSFEGMANYVSGERLHALYAYRWGGLDPGTGDPQGFLDGKLSKDYAAIMGNGATMNDLVNYGSSIPRFFGSLINEFRYKNFTLSFNLMYKLGYAVRENGLQYTPLYNGVVGYNEFDKRWQKMGDERFTDVPSMTYPANSQRDALYLLSETKVKAGDHVRLQYVNVQFTRRRFTFYLNAANLGIVWSKADVQHDPLYGYGVIPPSKTFSLGFKFSI